MLDIVGKTVKTEKKIRTKTGYIYQIVFEDNTQLEFYVEQDSEGYIDLLDCDRNFIKQVFIQEYF